jgi:RimJ/RimL family protein N-acetyltransferase
MDELARDDGVAPFTRVPDPVPDGFGTVWVDRYVQGWTTKENAGFAILDATTGEFVGFMALVALDLEGREAEAGYVVASPARGRGIATRALRLLTDWAFEELALERIELRIDTSNPASDRVAERAGYTREGVLRSVYVKPGLRADLTVYSRLRSDG